jgi:hypothetical protein
MAPAKRGAPASAQQVRTGKMVRLGKQSTKAEKLAKVHALQKAANDEVKLEAAARIEKRPQGHPPYPYTEALGMRIHDMLVTGISIMKVGKMPDMPSDVTMFKWIGNPTHPFSELYRKAKQLMVARFEEEIQEIADEEHIGEIVTERQAIVDGEIVTLKEVRKVDMVEHRKLRIEARRWSLSHLMPKKHGRQAEPTGSEGNAQLESLFQALKTEAQ